MRREPQLEAAWHSVNEVALSLAELRDEYLTLRGGEARWMRLTDAYSKLNDVEQALHDYLQFKAPLLVRMPDEPVLTMAKAAIENGRVLAEITRGELALLKRLT